MLAPNQDFFQEKEEDQRAKRPHSVQSAVWAASSRKLPTTPWASTHIKLLIRP